MEKQQLVNNFYVSHSVWINQCGYNLTGDSEKAHDLIQDTFVTILNLPKDRFEKLRFGATDLNQYFFYVTMKNRHINKVKKNKEDVVDPLESTIFDRPNESITEEQERRLELLHSSIRKELEELKKDERTWFDSMLFTIYMEEDHSMQSLSDKLNISKSTVFTSIKRMKTYLKEKYKTQYEQLKED